MPLDSQRSQTTRYGPANPITIPESVRQQYHDIDELMCWQFGVPTIRNFQTDGVLYQAMGCDAVVHAHTGIGKTLIAAGLHALPEFKEKLTILISPLIALQSDMVSLLSIRSVFGALDQLLKLMSKVHTFNNKYPTPVPAVVLNSTLDGKELSKVIKVSIFNLSVPTCCSRYYLFQDILAKKYQMLLISPESLLSLRIRDELLLHPTFKKMVASIVVDEAHCILVWGSRFRKMYGRLRVVRDYLPKAPVLAMSATLTPHML